MTTSSQISAALAASLALCLGCASNNDDPGPGDSPASTPKPADMASATATKPADQAKPEKAPPVAATTAGATLTSAPGKTVSGTLALAEANGVVTIELKAAGLEPGAHGFHFHETGDCSANDFTSAGGHFNPGEHQHGAPGATSHAGDLGNVTAAADGGVTYTITSAHVTLAEGKPNSVIGKAVIVHASADDLKSQPSGAAGARVACGVIASQ